MRWSLKFCFGKIARTSKSTLLSLTGLWIGEKKFGRKQKQKQININLFFCQNIDFVSVSRNAKILKNIFVVV
jgi:hypothetical protein